VVEEGFSRPGEPRETMRFVPCPGAQGIFVMTPGSLSIIIITDHEEPKRTTGSGREGVGRSAVCLVVFLMTAAGYGSLS
jgi:hypothetical protein